VGLACLAAGVPASADTLLDEARAALVAETAGAPP